MSIVKKTTQKPPQPIDLEKTVMEKISAGQITMKPKWYFILGSLLLLMSLVGLSLSAIFMTSLTLFLLRQHGPMGQWRLNLMLSSFPWWVPVLAIGGMVAGSWALQKYDFSYKKNFFGIVLGFILSIILTAFVLDLTGLNDLWFRRGPMRRFYPQVDLQDSESPRGYGRRWQQ